MTISVDWANEKHSIICYDVIGRWSWNDLHAVVKHAHAMIDGVGRRVDSIIDLRNSVGVPSGPLWHGRRLASGVHANTGRVVFVGAPTFLRVLFDTLLKIYPEAVGRMEFTDTLEAAYVRLGAASDVACGRSARQVKPHDDSAPA